MNRLVLLAVFFLIAVSIYADMPPLIDRELFFGDPEISGAQISPDGKYIAFLKPLNKTRNIWVKRTSEEFSAAKPITADTKRPIPFFFWSRDGKYVLYVQDKLGDENYQAYAVNPADSPVAGSEVPAARNLTDLKDVRVALYAVPKSDPDTIYIGLNDRDKAWHDLYKLKISTGERTLLRKNTDRIESWIFDNKDLLRLAVRSDESGETEILRVDAAGFKKIYSCDVLESCQPLQFHKDDRRFYMDTNKGTADLSRLVLFDPETSQETVVESDPDRRVDFGSALFSDLTNELLATTYQDDRERIYWKDKTYEADYKWLTGKLPDQELNFSSHTKDEQTWLLSAHSDTEPGETYLFERKPRRLTLQYKIREKLPREYLAEMKAIHYPSSDGLEVPAYLVLPKGVEPKGLPLVVFPHGGPWARDTWGFHSYLQFFANRGYAVLAPNFRGSTGYGKKFLNAGNRQWGDKMQDDITWGVKHLVAKGIADPKRVGIMGGSYGGYATLAAVAFTPDLYAAAVSVVGPSNLITLLDSIPPYWEAGRKIFYVRMGDPTTAEGKAQLQRQSPLSSANKIKTPLLVVQGANDPRVNKAESEQIVVALRDRGFPVEYILAPDEGHGFARPVNNMAMIAAAEKFFASHIDGRYQEGATPEVAARLKEITVDPKSVVIARKVDAASVGAPKTVADLQAGSTRYQAKIEMGQNSIALKIATTIKDENGAWNVTNTMETPMGPGADTAILEKGTLIVQKRSVKQGPVAIQVEYKDNKATGTLNMNGQDKPISVDVGGPVFADSAGAQQSIACLPLAEGYTTTFRNFDLQKQTPKLMQLKVAGSERVTVPAGAFDAYRVEITSADGGPDKMTMWVAKDSRKSVKMSAVLAQMGGAVLTAELAE
jgi:dipeptidyl aminopeptidase/acylaminoacyl peptidase